MVYFVTFWQDLSTFFNFRRFRDLICLLWGEGNSRQQIAAGVSWIVHPWHRPHFAYDSLVHPTTSVLLFPAFTRHGEMDACCLELTYHSEITRAFCSGGKGPPPLALKHLRDCQDGACGKHCGSFCACSGVHTDVDLLFCIGDI